tara:strand:- start:233 stop:649 length:417 start_codon:yes stop_codon:yes gene_type:complete
MNNNNDFIGKLRTLGLRPTKQRLQICKALFDRKETFHFTVQGLSKIIEKKFNSKISLATVYNTVQSFSKKGFLKEISINSDKNYYDTNITNHHHFFDENSKELIDLSSENVGKITIKKNIPGKKITSVEVLVKIANNN